MIQEKPVFDRVFMHTVERPPFEDFLPESGKLKNRQVMSEGLNAIKMAEDAGVTVC